MKLKFRAWDKKNKCWITDRLGMFLDGGLIYYDRKAGESDELIFREVDSNGYFMYSKVNLKDIELMQFTGLVDSKGVEIFEGDIIKGRSSDLIQDSQYPNTGIVYHHGSFCCKYWHGEINGHCEVIGNKYSNPDLAEGE